MADFPVNFGGNKYDLKQFLRDHPGGVDTLKYYKGKSVAAAMEKFGHSISAYHMLSDFKVDSDELRDSNLSGRVSENGRIITSDEGTRSREEIQFLEELESRLDWSKPILSQLEVVSPHYEQWINSAVYKKCRFFSNPLLESMTYTPWYLVPVFWVPIILGLGCLQYLEHVHCGDSCTKDSLTSVGFVWHLSQGVLLWTALEYLIHRWIFHSYPGNNITLIRLHFLLHGLHHKVPFDGMRQVFPPIPAFLITCLIYLGIRPALSYPLIKLTGGIIGYLTYDMIHFYVHHGSPTDGTYLYEMKRYHLNHHFVNHNKAFGISSKLWDHVFHTIVQVKKLGFSLKWR